MTSQTDPQPLYFHNCSLQRTITFRGTLQQFYYAHTISSSFFFCTVGGYGQFHKPFSNLHLHVHSTCVDVQHVTTWKCCIGVTPQPAVETLVATPQTLHLPGLLDSISLCASFSCKTWLLTRRHSENRIVTTSTGMCILWWLWYQPGASKSRNHV